MKKTISKLLSMILIAALIVTVSTGLSGATQISAAENSVKIYATIADGNGNLVVRQQSVDVTDVDEDGKLTISDALYCTHEKYYKGGADAGYKAMEIEGYDGLSLVKLWGVENGGSYGYYLNDQMAWSLSDVISEGDYVNAYIYADTVGFSDAYSFFNKRVYGRNKNKYVTFKLSYYQYDENWNLVQVPMANARLIINGIETDYITNVNGVASVLFEESGSYFVTAVHPAMTIVPPASLVFVKAAKGDEITVKGLKYTVTKVGSISGKLGRVTISKDSAGSKKIPKKIEYAGVTFKVKKA